MFKRFPFILLIAALGACFVAAWVWQPRLLPHHFAHSAHKALRGALETRGINAPEDDDEAVEATRCGALGNAPEGKCDKLNAPQDGSNEKHAAGLLECDRSEAAKKLRKTLQKEETGVVCLAARVASREASAKRIEFIAADRLDDPVLAGGGTGMFLEHCPPSPHSGLPGGCLAVEYSRNGEVRHAVPFRIQAFEAVNIVPEKNRDDEDTNRRQASRPKLQVRSVSPYPGGDLLVHLTVGTHRGRGVARVARDGQPRWFRKDYSLPWPHIIDDNLALVRRRQREPVRPGRPVECPAERWLVDTVDLIDGKGRLLSEINLLEALLESPYITLFDPAKWCDNPVWANSIHQVGADVSGADNIAPGDIVASFPDLDAFGIIGQNNLRLKQLIRGDFTRQHGVRHFEKSRFLMFSRDEAHPGQPRLLMFDLAIGKQTILFPRDHTPTHLRLRTKPYKCYKPYCFPLAELRLAVSPDRRRVLFSEPKTGRAFELRLSDGRVLNIFRQLHDLSSIDDIPDPFRQRAWVFRTVAFEYANPF